MLSPERRMEIWKIGDWLRNGTDPDPLHAEPAHQEDDGDPLDYNVCTAEGIAYCAVPALDDDFMTKALAEAVSASGRVIHELLDHITEQKAQLLVISEVAVKAEEAETRLVECRKEMFNPTSALCRKYGCQCCFYCDDMECGDNTSPAKKRIAELEAALEAWDWLDKSISAGDKNTNLWVDKRTEAQALTAKVLGKGK